MASLKIQFSGTEHQRVLHYRILSPLNIDVIVARNYADADAALRNVYDLSCGPIVLAIDTEWTIGPVPKKASAQNPDIVQIYDGQKVIILQCATIPRESYCLLE